MDEKLIAHALKQGNNEATYILLHIVETVSASFSGTSTDDIETRKDKERLEVLAAQMQQMGYHVQTEIGYQNRVSEIVRIVKDVHADMLVMGAHRHRGLKDILYGQTVNQVRHKVNIPVLIVN